MKREILFKAKRIDTKDWIYGLPIKCEYGFAMTNECSFDHVDGNEWNFILRLIDEKTICQYINKKDNKGNMIFEGDYDADGNCVVWCDNCNGFEFAQLDVLTKDIFIPCHRCDGNFFFEDHINDFEIVGNIAD